MGMNQSDQKCKACHAVTTTADESGLCAPCRIVRDGLRENIAQSDQPAQAFRELLRRLVDETWSVATESNTVPSTEWADRIISRIPELAAPASPQSDQPAQEVTPWRDWHCTECGRTEVFDDQHEPMTRCPDCNGFVNITRRTSFSRAPLMSEKAMQKLPWETSVEWTKKLWDLANDIYEIAHSRREVVGLIIDYERSVRKDERDSLVAPVSQPVAPACQVCGNQANHFRGETAWCDQCYMKDDTERPTTPSSGADAREVVDKIFDTCSPIHGRDQAAALLESFRAAAYAEGHAAAVKMLGENGFAQRIRAETLAEERARIARESK